ncbi:SubName: Full=Uncharacterized protein {ECO:0000313/EMBL:CCA74668.1} [Serendipita indica DSM 11827]|nr:SubName: Full=Uncharacterized protein {ECO:0000313/EMBL:CCA74668.1} [Serendipita indica DSM 11827]
MSAANKSTSKRHLIPQANGPSTLSVAGDRSPAPQPVAHSRPRRQAAIQAKAAAPYPTAAIKREQETKHFFQSITLQSYASPVQWMRPSAQGRTPDKRNELIKTQLATSPTFQPSGYARPLVQNALYKLEAESSDIQSRNLCGRGGHAPSRPLSNSQPPASSSALVQSSSRPSRYRVVRTPPRRRPTLRDVVWFLMTAAKLDAYHQKLVWLYAGNSWVAHLKVLLWVRDFIRKQARLPMLVNIRATIGAKGGVESVICQFDGCQMPKPFKEVQSAAEHVVSKHVGGMTWKCKSPGCEKVYNHSFDLKRHEKKHGVSTQSKPRTVTRIQRATSARSKAARNAQVATLSSAGPPLLAPPPPPTGHPPIFPSASEYPDLSLQCDHIMSSPSSVMASPGSPWSTSFAPSNVSSPIRIEQPLSSPNRGTGIHVELPANSQKAELTSYSRPADDSFDQYLDPFPESYPGNTYNLNPEQHASEHPAPNLYSASTSAGGAFANSSQYSTLPPSIQSIPLLGGIGNANPDLLDDAWNIPFQWEPPSFDEALDLLNESYLESTHGASSAISQECSSVAASSPLEYAYRSQASTSLGSHSNQLQPADQLYGFTGTLGLEQLTGQPTSSRSLVSGQFVNAPESSRRQQRTSSLSMGDMDPTRLHWSGQTPADYEHGWSLAEDHTPGKWEWPSS